MGIYLDNAATSYPKPEAVAKSVYDFMINNGTSSGRGSYKMAMKSDFLVYETRKLIGNLFKSKSNVKELTETVIFIKATIVDKDNPLTNSKDRKMFNDFGKNNNYYRD